VIDLKVPFQNLLHKYSNQLSRDGSNKR